MQPNRPLTGHLCVIPVRGEEADRVMVAYSREKHPAGRRVVRDTKVHHFSVEAHRALEVAHLDDHVTELLDTDWAGTRASLRGSLELDLCHPVSLLMARTANGP